MSPPHARRFALLIGLLLPLVAVPARAQGREPPEENASTARLVAFNVALTGTFAVGRRWIEGGLAGWGDALETFLYGGAGGYGFYQAKRLVGNRKPLAGMGLAYLSASVVENAVQGHHPLGHVRFGPGPVDLRVRTPLARETVGGPPVTVEVNAVSALSLAVLPLLGHKPVFRGGTLCYRVDGTFAAASGNTFNRTAVLTTASEREVTHEVIHVIQSLQVGAVTPHYRLSALWPGVDRSFGGVVAWDVQFDWLYTVLTPATMLWNYENRWPEVEAFSLGFEPEPGAK